MFLKNIFIGECAISRKRQGPAIWLQLFLLSIVMCGRAWDPEWIMPTSKLALRDKVVEMFSHAYTSYMNHAYPADELMPIACKGRIRGITLSRGDVDDTLGNFSLTLVDTLDTLAVLGMYDEFEEAVRKLESEVRFDTDVVVSVFETNIRVLGGLLGGHAVALEIQSKHDRMRQYNGSLLRMAKEVGDRLLPAFNTTTGIPVSRVNLATGAVRKVKDRDTCTACAGTMILEMAALSRFTGDPVYEQKARKAMDYLWSRRQRSSDLMGTVLNVYDGEWIRKESGVGAGIDSYYEYLLKAYILFADEDYLLRFNTHYSAIKQYVKQGPLLIDVHMHKPTVAAKSFMDALGAFWPGLLVLKGDLLPAIENHELLHQVFQKHKFLPEAFTTNFDIYWGQYPLRPEFAESTYLLYKATADPYYLEVGKTIIENLEKHTRVKCGYAGIKDVRTFKHEDRMDSYFLAEMFKYLYLLFTPDKDTGFLPAGEAASAGINVDDYLLTTEAHLLPLYLSNMGSADNSSKGKWHATKYFQENTERHCAKTEFVRPSNLGPLRSVRKKVKNFFREVNPPQAQSCSRIPGPEIHTFKIQDGQIKWQGPRMLLAKDFEPGKKEHIDLIKLMGITSQVLKDGSIQLDWKDGLATSTKNSQEGRIFMYELEEMKKQPAENAIEPILVQLLSQPYLGAVVLKAGPAQFGPDVYRTDPVSAPLANASPFDACSPLVNSEEVRGKTVVTQRGSCMFVEKVKNIEEAGGVAALIIDNNADSKFNEGPTFTMAGDGQRETSIPAAFLFTKEANILRTCMSEFRAEGRPSLEVLIGSEAKSLDEVMAIYSTTNGPTKAAEGETDGGKDEARDVIAAKDNSVSDDAAFEAGVSDSHATTPTSEPQRSSKVEGLETSKVGEGEEKDLNGRTGQISEQKAKQDIPAAVKERTNFFKANDEL